MQIVRYGTVEVIETSADLTVWRIQKDDDEVEPYWLRGTRDDLLIVLEGMLCVELRDGEPVVVGAGETYVVPAGSA